MLTIVVAGILVATTLVLTLRPKGKLVPARARKGRRE